MKASGTTNLVGCLPRYILRLQIAAVNEPPKQFSCVVLQALHPLIQDGDSPATRDNAAGAVGRMLTSMPLQLPLDQVLPVLLSKPPHPVCCHILAQPPNKALALHLTAA